MSVSRGFLVSLLLCLLAGRCRPGPASGSRVPGEHILPRAQRIPSVASDASGNFVVVWTRSDQDGTTPASSASGTTATGTLWAESSGSTRTRLVTRPCGRLGCGRQLRRRLGERWPGRERLRHLRPAVRQRREPSGRRVPGQHLHDGQPVSPFGRLGCQRQLRRRLDELRQERRDRGRLRPAVRQHGNPLGGEFQVNTYTTGDQTALRSPRTPPATSSSSGRAWPGRQADSGIFAQRYDSSGTPLGGEFQVNTYTTRSPGSALGGLGRRPATSSSSGRATPGREPIDIFGQRYDSTGTLWAGSSGSTRTLRITSATARRLGRSGNFVVVWGDAIGGWQRHWHLRPAVRQHGRPWARSSG